MTTNSMPYAILRELPWTARELCRYARETKCRSRLRQVSWQRYAAGELAIACKGRLPMIAPTLDGRSVIYLPVR